MGLDWRESLIILERIWMADHTTQTTSSGGFEWFSADPKTSSWPKFVDQMLRIIRLHDSQFCEGTLNFPLSTICLRPFNSACSRSNPQPLSLLLAAPNDAAPCGRSGARGQRGHGCGQRWGQFQLSRRACVNGRNCLQNSAQTISIYTRSSAYV